LRVGGALLIHVGDAESVETIGFGGAEVRSGFLQGRSGGRLRGARVQKDSSGEERREANCEHDNRTPKGSLHQGICPVREARQMLEDCGAEQ